MNGNIYAARIEQLRSLMKKEGVYMYMIPDSDYHNSEYVGDYFKCREYMSGFTGSNGILMVSEDEAALWTDGRYFVQAARELEGSGIRLMKMGEPGVPRIEEYIGEKIIKGRCFGVDARVLSAKTGMKYAGIISEKGGSIRPDLDLVTQVWTDRPGLPAGKVFLIPDDIAGESVTSKLERIRSKMTEYGCEAYVLSKLDDIMWLLNIRGCDIAYTPVALSYVYLTGEDACLFIQEKALDQEAAEHFKKNNITVKHYDSFIGFLENAVSGLAGKVLIDSANSNYAVYGILEKALGRDQNDNPASHDNKGNDRITDRTNPTEEMEAVRNEKQMELTRDFYIRDSAELFRFLCRIKRDVKAGKAMNEYEAAKELDEMRSHIPGFIELSFSTISAYGPNAAMMHYEATADSYAELKPEGMYLVDSGGQYMGATTDVTRTIALGPVTDDMRRDFTLTCIGMLRLADAVFLEGCTGRNLDILARGELWKRGIDYKCGTGHGVGYILGVHTGPQRIRFKYIEEEKEAVLRAGMIVSDEPGVYKEDMYGIRIENILEIRDAYTNSDGHFMKFEHLTWVPIDLELIDTSLMERSDITLLNRYHESVRTKLMPHMQNEEEREWLMEATEAVG